MTGPHSATAAWRRRVAEVADLVTWSTLMKPATLGRSRLVCIDGGAGAGKSSLGEAVRDTAAEHGTVDLVHLDDLLDGWEGLPEVADTLRRDVLTPLRSHRAGRYRRYDWNRGRFADEVAVEPVDLLVVEGVGSGASGHAADITTLVWVESPRDLRLSRGLARDGEALRPQWVAWMREEEDLFRRERTRERADMVVDGTGEADRAVVLT